MNGKRIHFVIFTLSLVLVLFVGLFGDQVAVLKRIDNFWLDRMARLRSTEHVADPNIVIIDIDDYSLTRMVAIEEAGQWPWARALHGYVIDWLEEQGVKQIAFDIWFTEKDNYRPGSDQFLGEELDKFSNIYLPTFHSSSDQPEKTPLIPSYEKGFSIGKTGKANMQAHVDLYRPIVGKPENWKMGIINYEKDEDERGRRYFIYEEVEGWRLYSMPAVMARNEGVAIPEQDSILLDWVGPIQKPFTKYSYADIYAKILEGKPLPELRGKTIFIGSTATGIHDIRPTSVSEHFPGLYMLATAYDNLKNGKQLHRISSRWLIPLGILPIFLSYLLLKKKLYASYPMASMLLVVAIATIIAYMISHRLATQAYMLPVNSMTSAAVIVTFVGALIQYFEERRSREHTIAMFGRFLDPRVVNNLVDEGLSESALKARSVDLTILFSDIRGFTTLSETRAPQEILTLLNAYFSKQVAVIFKYQGTHDKFIGDAIMAFWGAPLPDPNHAANAVAAALDMSDAVDEFKKELNLPDFEIGIGIHSGPAVVGMLGSDQRLEYTAIGDTINTGSRLEGLTKGISRILVSESTRKACGDRFEFVPKGSFNVKGRSEAVIVYEPRRKVSPPVDAIATPVSEGTQAAT